MPLSCGSTLFINKRASPELKYVSWNFVEVFVMIMQSGSIFRQTILALAPLRIWQLNTAD